MYSKLHIDYMHNHTYTYIKKERERERERAEAVSITIISVISTKTIYPETSISKGIMCIKFHKLNLRQIKY